MAKPDVWPAVHEERAALAADLEGLADDRWELASLCEGWTVRDVLAHMTGTARVSGANFFPKLLASGFSLKRLQAKDIAVLRGDSPADTLSNFKEELNSTTAPPGPAETVLGETIVHAEDIRRPLGIAHSYPTEAAVRVADFYKRSNLILGAKRRIAGLTLQATDADWKHGQGPSVSDPMIDLVLAMTVRKVALEGLVGEGVVTLRERS
ncbi:MAG: maleylpyruvate isomerase family mycothiol-dependent enzyme [Acidimicrobiales bacterium]